MSESHNRRYSSMSNFDYFEEKDQGPDTPWVKQQIRVSISGIHIAMQFGVR